MVGTLWKSASSVPATTLASTIALPPAMATARLLSTRALIPRSQTTIRPATFAGSSVPRKQSAISLSGVAGLSPFGSPTAVDSTIGSDGVAAAVDTPL